MRLSYDIQLDEQGGQLIAGAILDCRIEDGEAGAEAAVVSQPMGRATDSPCRESYNGPRCGEEPHSAVLIPIDTSLVHVHIEEVTDRSAQASAKGGHTLGGNSGHIPLVVGSSRSLGVEFPKGGFVPPFLV